MRKSFLLIPLAGLLATGSCTPEKGPYINFFGGKAADTTYTASPESSQLRNVLMEEFTGASCPNCPQGHAIIASLEAANPNRIVAIGIHVFNFSQANPIPGLSLYDFRTQVGSNLATAIFGAVSFEPSAVINRKYDSSTTSYYIDRDFWGQQVNASLATATPVNMYLTSVFDSSLMQSIIDVKVAFTQSYSKKVNLTVAITEDDIIDAQEDIDAQNHVVKDTIYTHKHVLRDILTTTPGGDSFLDSLTTKTAGRVYERVFVYKPNDTTWNKKWNLNNCKVVAFVNDNMPNDKLVQQAISTKLK
ncbi:MAG: Omp28-related outer membrane protein [Bacteroidota bacterium]